MDIRSRMLKIANNIIEEAIKSFEMTEDEWKKYNELHPGADRNNHTIIPNKKNNMNIERKMSEDEKIEIAKNPKTNGDVLLKLLSKNPSRNLAITLLKNPNTPNDNDEFVELAYQFIADGDVEGIDCILNHKNSDERTAIEIAREMPEYFDGMRNIRKKHWWSHTLDEILDDKLK